MIIKQKYRSDEIDIGYHCEGYRIDKTASALNRYTKWSIESSGEWVNPVPVCFHSLPAEGWCKAESFDWSGLE